MSFKCVQYLLFEKRKPELDAELLAEFNPFLTTKTFSFVDKGSYCNYINDSLNRYGNVLESKEDKFRFFENIIPRLKRQKYDYIKKPKNSEIEKKPIPEFYSQREIDFLNNQSN